MNEARIWKGVLGSEMKVALNLERPREQKGMSVNRLPAPVLLFPLVRSRLGPAGFPPSLGSTAGELSVDSMSSLHSSAEHL